MPWDFWRNRGPLERREAAGPILPPSTAPVPAVLHKHRPAFQGKLGEGGKTPTFVHVCKKCPRWSAGNSSSFSGVKAGGAGPGLALGLPWLQGHPSRLGSTSRVQTGQRVTGSNPEVKSSSSEGKTNMSTQSMLYNLFQFTSSHAYKI